MGLINTPTTRPTLTLAQRQATKLQRIKSTNTILFNQIVAAVSANLAEVWNDPDQSNFSPQQVLSLLGTDAGSLVAASASLVALVNSQVPGTLLAEAPKPLTVNGDGTVTVGI